MRIREKMFFINAHCCRRGFCDFLHPKLRPRFRVCNQTSAFHDVDFFLSFLLLLLSISSKSNNNVLSGNQSRRVEKKGSITVVLTLYEISNLIHVNEFIHVVSHLLFAYKPPSHYRETVSIFLFLILMLTENSSALTGI